MSWPFWLQAWRWERFYGLVHGFSTRLPRGDLTPEGLGFSGLSLATLRQVHSSRVVVLEAPSEGELWGDGLMTQKRGLLLGIVTADCVPVLLVEPGARVVAALHAGWRGTLKGIVPRAVKKLKEHFGVDPKKVFAALGPAIGPCCYEVGLEIGESMVGRWGKAGSAAWHARGKKGFLDLRLLNTLLLEQLGVPRRHIELVGPCTACREDSFASYRREGKEAGRQLSLIGWLP